MLLVLLNYVVLRALWKTNVHLISTLVNNCFYYYLLVLTKQIITKYVIFTLGQVFL